MEEDISSELHYSSKFTLRIINDIFVLLGYENDKVYFCKCSNVIAIGGF